MQSDSSHFVWQRKLQLSERSAELLQSDGATGQSALPSLDASNKVQLVLNASQERGKTPVRMLQHIATSTCNTHPSRSRPLPLERGRFT